MNGPPNTAPRDNTIMPPKTTYSMYKEVSNPTAIDFSVYAKFTSVNHSNLIVAKGNVLEIFTLLPMRSGSTQSNNNQLNNQSTNQPMKRVAEFKLHASIASIAVLKLEGCQRDSLMLAFEPSKIAIVHFDPSSHQLITLDTAIYDQTINQEQLSSMGRINRSLGAPVIRIDPLNRCAAILVAGIYMVVCPLFDLSIKAQSIESIDQSTKPYLFNQPGSILRPYIQSLNQFNIQSISDFQFLNGYNQPTILVMHEIPYTWEGRYAVNRATKRLLNLAVEMVDRSISVIGHVTMPLPHDADTILALPSPIDGAIILSSNLIFHFYNQNIDYILSTNQFGDQDSRYHAEKSSIVCQLLVASACVLNQSNNQAINPSVSQPRVEILLALKDGQLLLLSVEPSGTSVRRMTLFKLAQAPILSDLTTVSQSTSHNPATKLVDDGNFLVFMASRLGQSLLVELRARSESEMIGEQIEADRLEDAERNEREERDRARQSAMQNEFGNDQSASQLADQSTNVDAKRDFMSSFAGDDLFDDLFGFSSRRDDEEKRASERKELRARARAENSRAYELIVRDALFNAAPCSDAMVWPSIDGVPDKPVTQFLHLSGVGSEGSLQFIQKGVTPNVITSFPLEQRCQGCFAVYAPDPSQAKRKRKRDRNGDEIDQSNNQLDEYHRYVFISTASSTLALLTGDDVTQVEASSAQLQGDVPSLFVGNVIGQSVVCQVWHAGVRFVYQSDHVVDHSASFIFDRDLSGEPVRIVSADICDPYVAVTLSDGSMRLLLVKLTTQSSDPISVDIITPELPALPEAEQQRGTITAISLYKDRNLTGLFVPNQSTGQPMPNGDSSHPSMNQSTNAAAAAPMVVEEEEIDELELLLGGGSKPDADQSMKTDSNGAHESANQANNQAGKLETEPVFVCVICRSHFIEIYSLPSFTLLFSAPRFVAGSTLLTSQPLNQVDPHDHVIQSSSLSPVVEVCLTALTPTSQPTLLAFTRAGDLLIYQSFSHQSPNQSINLRFLRHAAPLTRTGSIKIGRGGPSIAPPEWMYGRRFVPFQPLVNQSINGHSGMIIGGWNPHIIVGERDSLRLHEFVWARREDRANRVFEESLSLLDNMESSVDRAMRLVPGLACSIPLRNVNCTSGMIFIDIAGYFHIAELAPSAPLPFFIAESTSASVTLTRPETLNHAHYDSSLVVRSLPLASTPRFITYHSLTTSLALCMSSPKPIVSMDEPTPRSLTVYEDSFEVLLLNALTMSVIGRFDDFDAREIVTCMTCVSIKEKEYVSVGTGLSSGEESQVRGRILLLDVFYAAADQAANASSTRFLKLRAFAQAEKGVVSSIASMDGHICVGVGSRVMLYEYDGKNLIGRAFLDTQSFIFAIKVLKNLMIVTDLCDSIHFAVWDPIVKQIMLLGATHERRFVSALDWIVDGPELSMLVADHNGDCCTMRYEPKQLPPDPPLPSSVYLTATLTLGQFFATAKQQRLTIKTDFHTDSVLNKTLSFVMKSTAGPSMMQPQPFPLRSFLWSFTTNGRCSMFSVVDEVWHRRLNSLSSQVAAHTQPIAACNARHYRQVQVNKEEYRAQKGILDFCLLQQYLMMDVDTQLRLARMIGLQPDQIIEYIASQEWQTQL